MTGAGPPNLQKISWRARQHSRRHLQKTTKGRSRGLFPAMTGNSPSCFSPRLVQRKRRRVSALRRADCASAAPDDLLLNQPHSRSCSPFRLTRVPRLRYAPAKRRRSARRPGAFAGVGPRRKSVRDRATRPPAPPLYRKVCTGKEARSCKTIRTDTGSTTKSLRIR